MESNQVGQGGKLLLNFHLSRRGGGLPGEVEPMPEHDVLLQAFGLLGGQPLLRERTRDETTNIFFLS